MLLMLFGKKKNIPAPIRMPTGRVIELSSQGYSEGEIIDSLREEGYNPKEVDAAMRSALKSSVRMQPQGRPGPVYEEERLPRFDETRMRSSKVPEPVPRQRLQRSSEPIMGDIREEDIPPEIPRLPEIPRPAPRRSIPLRPAPEPEPEHDDLDGPPLEVEDLPPAPKPIEQRRRPIPREPEPIPDIDIDDDFDIPEPKPQAKLLQSRPFQAMPLQADMEPERIGKIGDLILKMDDIEDKIDSLDARIKSMEKRSRLPIGQLDVYQESIDELSERIEAVENGLKDSINSVMKSLKSLAETIKIIKKQTAVRKR